MKTEEKRLNYNSQQLATNHGATEGTCLQYIHYGNVGESRPTGYDHHELVSPLDGPAQVGGNGGFGEERLPSVRHR